jgi:hypothetical protein
MSVYYHFIMFTLIFSSHIRLESNVQYVFHNVIHIYIIKRQFADLTPLPSTQPTSPIVENQDDPIDEAAAAETKKRNRSSPRSKGDGKLVYLFYLNKHISNIYISFFIGKRLKKQLDRH